MLDTKLKNNYKAGWIVVLIILAACAAGMLAGYPTFATARKQIQEESQKNQEYEKYLRFVDSLTEGNYILYDEVTGTAGREEIQENAGWADFYLMRKYMDLEVFDKDGLPLLDYTTPTEQSWLTQQNNVYALRAMFAFGREGTLENVQVEGYEMNERFSYELEQFLVDEYYGTEYDFLESPSEVLISYGITDQEMEAFWSDHDHGSPDYYLGYYLAYSNVYSKYFCVLCCAIILSALLIPLKKSWGMGTQKVFRAPLEVVVCVIMFMPVCYSYIGKVVWDSLDHLGVTDYEDVLNGFMWFVVFAAVYWCATCIRAIFSMGKDYWKERCLITKWCYNSWQRRKMRKEGKEEEFSEEEGVLARSRNAVERLWERVKAYCLNVYQEMLHLDLKKDTNKTILKVVVLNFVFLAVCSALWFFGLFVLAVYSLALFLLIRKYLDALRAQYEKLLEETSQLAQGNLNVLLEDDYGVFNPIGEEVERIRDGFKLAVEKEVKSERMKTELITNVSHDLKTPLTAIITYVDLLKSEADEEKRKEYISVLEQKSLRLKVLIEDLFEISKAASKNVTMNFMDVDLANLLKQVNFEHEEILKKADLELRCKFPEGKVILWLDSQKTYRIFENLIINAAKYAMPHTRVYMDLVQEADGVHVILKNVSAEELCFDGEEITARFVRGDASRNTEGSGLGLAIAKNFTELQNGCLKVTTDADLFKAEVIFPYKQEVSETEVLTSEPNLL